MPSVTIAELQAELLSVLDQYWHQETELGQYDVKESLAAIGQVAAVVRGMPLRSTIPGIEGTPEQWSAELLRRLDEFADNYRDDSEYGGGRGSVGSAMARVYGRMRELGVVGG